VAVGTEGEANFAHRRGGLGAFVSENHFLGKRSSTTKKKGNLSSRKKGDKRVKMFRDSLFERFSDVSSVGSRYRVCFTVGHQSHVVWLWVPHVDGNTNHDDSE
jgi:hypothetical protein